MTTFKVWETQTVRFTYEVEAETREKAYRKAADGESLPSFSDNPSSGVAVTSRWLELSFDPKLPTTKRIYRIKGDRKLHTSECVAIYENRGWWLHGAVECKTCGCHK